MTSYKEAYKYPFIAAEILSSKNKLIVDKILAYNEAENFILDLIKVLDNKEILNSTIPGYITKIISAHINEELFLENVNNNKEIIFNIFLKYIYNDSYRDLFYLIYNEGINKGIKDFNELIGKLFDSLLIYMNKYILNADENLLIELKDGINNIIYIFVKLAENNEDIFNIIIKKLQENELIQKIKENIKEIDGTDKTNENNINVLFCISNSLMLISNLLNIIVTKKENNIYAYNKYYLTTIYDPPYSMNNIIYNLPDNNQKENIIKDDKENNNDKKNKEAEMIVEEENNKENIIINLLIDIGIVYLNEAYSIFEKYIKVINNLKKSIIFSYYDKMADLIILLLITDLEKSNRKITNFLDLVLINLTKLIIDYPDFNIINNKTFYIFKLTSEKEIQITKSPIITSLKEFLTEKKINELITNEGVIANNDNNNIFLVNILNLLEKQENEKINKYLQKTNEGLFENEKMELGDYVPKPDEDEIIFEKKQDIHDTEGFIFTPKKVIEDSRKILKNLKEFDV